MNPIEQENERPGDTAWQCASANIDELGRSTGIEGYCTRMSLRNGDALEICVSSSSPYTVDLYRMGFYGGAGARHMQHFGDRPGTKRDDPPIGDRQLRECTWPTSVSFTIPSDWVSGVYLGKLSQSGVEGGTQSYVIFVLRDDRRCDFLFKTSDTTWAAYNPWPDRFSLYDFHGDPEKEGYWGPDVRVSFDRPFAMSKPWYALREPQNLAWMVGASQFLTFEYPLLFWMESRGYDVSYISSLDLHATSAVALRRRARALLAPGHDEYYSVPMHDNLQRAIEASDGIPEKGLSVGFFSGGSLTGVLEVSPSVGNAGRPHRIIRRIGRWGPFEPWLLATHPEQSNFGAAGSFPDGGELMGARLVDPAVGVADWECASTQGGLGSRFYEGTGLSDGARIRSLIGNEFTGSPLDKPGLEILAQGHLIDGMGVVTGNRYAATLYPGPKDNFVFNASTMWWPQFLNFETPLPFPEGREPRFEWQSNLLARDADEMAKVERMTRNLFDMFRA